jgi:hypothetical protein
LTLREIVLFLILHDFSGLFRNSLAIFYLWNF